MLRFTTQDIAALIEMNPLAGEQLKNIILRRENEALRAELATHSDPELATNGHGENVAVFDVEQTQEAHS